MPDRPARAARRERYVPAPVLQSPVYTHACFSGGHDVCREHLTATRCDCGCHDPEWKKD